MVRPAELAVVFAMPGGNKDNTMIIILVNWYAHWYCIGCLATDQLLPKLRRAELSSDTPLTHLSTGRLETSRSQYRIAGA
eukprot:COSAG02_NODE_1925_length_10344_cov_49.023231_9_plen_80_part_00